MRLTILILLSLLSTHYSTLYSTPITSLDKEVSKLADHIQPPSTLILTVRHQGDLPEAQRLLTLAASQEQQTLILIALPDNAIETATIRRIANRFFQSDFSRPLTYFIKAADHPYPEFKTLILSPVEPAPIFASETYPPELP